MPTWTYWYNLMIKSKGLFDNHLVYNFKFLLLMLKIWGKYMVEMRMVGDDVKKERRQIKN